MVGPFFSQTLFLHQIFAYSRMQLVPKVLGLFGGHIGAVVPGRWLLELFPILVAVTLWGRFFANKRILVETDNKGVLFAVNCLSSGSLFVVKILRHLFFLCLKFNIWIKAQYTPGKLNVVADSLSRFQMQRFHRLLPEADEEGTRCPDYLWELI